MNADKGVSDIYSGVAQRKPSVGKWILVIGIIIVLVAGVVLAWIFFAKSSGAENSDTDAGQNRQESGLDNSNVGGNEDSAQKSETGNQDNFIVDDEGE